jgi:hypothetical protein
MEAGRGGERTGGVFVNPSMRGVNQPQTADQSERTKRTSAEKTTINDAVKSGIRQQTLRRRKAEK